MGTDGMAINADEVANGVLPIRVLGKGEIVAREFAQIVKAKWPDLRILIYVGDNPTVMHEVKG